MKHHSHSVLSLKLPLLLIFFWRIWHTCFTRSKILAIESQEKKRLEDTIAELRLQATANLSAPPSTPGFAYESTPLRIRPLSPESKAVMQELDSPPAVKEMRSELSDARVELQRLTEEVSCIHTYLQILFTSLATGMQRQRVTIFFVNLHYQILCSVYW